MRVTRRFGDRGRDERGAILVVSAVLMTAMLAFAALGVDIGNARQHRRASQNAADAAALAAAQDLPNTTTAIATAKAYAQDNYGTPTTAWVGCTDSERLALVPDTANSNQCISFSSDRRQVRVRMPVDPVRTFFGGMFGRPTIAVSADAVAASVVGRSDRIVPAAVTGALGTGLLCIEQAGNNQPCATRQRGQFGSLSSPRLNLFKPASNVEQTSLAISYAMNMDHDIQRYSAYPAVCDGTLRSPCNTTNVGTGSTANHVLATTGNDVPPVTEGYVTGFSAATTDAGTVAFCGRLQRPDYTVGNQVDPRPGNCATPGTPTTTILGNTVNGRHLYYWLTSGARSLFYPEVVALGYPDTDQRLAIGGPVFGAGGVGNPGDARLDCFLAGYRWNSGTATETLPTCAGVTYPTTGSTAWAKTVGDDFRTVTYSRNDGNANWVNSWTETGDDGSPTTGKILITSATLGFERTPPGASLVRTADLRDPSTGTLATAATLTLRVDPQLGGAGAVVLETSTDGTTWTTLDTWNSVSTSGWASRSYSLASSQISAATRVRFRQTGSGTGGSKIFFDDLQIAYSGGTPGVTGRVAPIFNSGLQNDPRWGVIPRISYWPSPNAAPIEGFWGFFGYTSYVSSSKVQAFDAWVFDPALTLADPATDTFGFGFSPQPFARLIS